MNGTGHRLTGALTVTGLAAVNHWPVPAAVVMLAASVATSAGVLSPDIDNTRLWRRLDRFIPDEWLGQGGPLRHRGLMHWWGLPVAAWFGSQSLIGPWWALAVVNGALLGWVAHIFADLVYGKPGIPIAPWWWHVGVGIPTTGWPMNFTNRFLLPAGFVAVGIWTTTQ